jgi:hypothetical protein
VDESSLMSTTSTLPYRLRTAGFAPRSPLSVVSLHILGKQEPVFLLYPTFADYAMECDMLMHLQRRRQAMLAAA